jgi:undecaprenyl-diphosphatase
VRIIDAFLYGVFQGLTEFLPISSSAHLAVFPHVFHIPDPGLTFDLMLHFGTVCAVMIYFRKKIFLYARFFYLMLIQRTWNLKGEEKSSTDYYVFKNILISTIITLFMIIVLKKYSEIYGRRLENICVMMILFGLFMWLADLYGKRTKQTMLFFQAKLDLKRSCLLGFAQALAIFPGVSRAGATLTAARMLNISKEEAAEYSFLMSIPIILMGTAQKTVEYLGYRFVGHVPAVDFHVGMCVIGVVVSFVVGLLVIHCFLKFIRKINFFYFFLYRICFSLFVYVYFLKS